MSVKLVNEWGAIKKQWEGLNQYEQLETPRSCDSNASLESAKFSNVSISSDVTINLEYFKRSLECWFGKAIDHLLTDVSPLETKRQQPGCWPCFGFRKTHAASVSPYTEDAVDAKALVEGLMQLDDKCLMRCGDDIVSMLASLRKVEDKQAFKQRCIAQLNVSSKSYVGIGQRGL